MYSLKCLENMMEILPEVGVHQDWMPVFQENHDLLGLLDTSILKVEENLQQNNKPMIPEKSKLLLALSRCPPQAIKVVILGHDPISDASRATGFSFSFPEGQFIDKNVGQRDFGLQQGKSLADLHDVLVEAGYLVRGVDYDGCHEVWADGGVLLLNAALTYNKEKQHFPMWQQFVAQLLFLVAQHSKERPLFFLCWGTNANDISKQLVPKLQEYYKVQIMDEGDHSEKVDGSAQLVVFTGHHPTYPINNNQFIRQATNQFIAIKKWYPDLFKLTEFKKVDSTEELTNAFKERFSLN